MNATRDDLVPPHEPIAPPDELVRAEPSEFEQFFASISAVLAKEARWRMRGRRAFVVVTVYVALLGLIVAFIYSTVQDRSRQFDPITGETLPSLDLVSATAAMAAGQAVFVAILALETFLILLLAPALASGAISMEREKQTLELLITTPISTLGMVVGKLFSSLAFVLLLVLASLPLMSLVFVLGGVAPEDVLRAYVVLFVMGIGAGSVGLFMSALVKRTQIATALAYVVGFVLTLGTLFVHSWMYATSVTDPLGRGVEERHAPEILLLLNPLVADADIMCTAVPSTGACTYITTIVRNQPQFVGPTPRDSFWPRSVFFSLVLAASLTLLTTQLISPSRRIKRSRRSAAPDSPEAPTDEMHSAGQ